MSSIFKDIPYLKEKLLNVKNFIDTELQTDEEDFNKVIKRYFNDNAKMLRPALVLIAASYNKNLNGKEIECAAAAEMLHVATLIHDDIIDNAKIRRGVRTIHDEYDVGYAVICGDMLYAKSYQLILSNNSYDGIKYVSNRVYDMAFGEVKQYIEKFNYQLSIDKYLDIIAKKSAALFQSNLAIGAQLAGVEDDEVDLLLDFGLNFGMMFQIQDDILDVLSYDMHKPVQSDMKRGVYTLPILICAYNNEEFSKMLSEYQDDNLEFVELDKFLKATDSVEKAIDMYKMYAENCFDIIENLSDEDVKFYLISILEKTGARIQW